jgi:hypothetical protein
MPVHQSRAACSALVWALTCGLAQQPIRGRSAALSPCATDSETLVAGRPGLRALCEDIHPVSQGHPVGYCPFYCHLSVPAQAVLDRSDARF